MKPSFLTSIDDFKSFAEKVFVSPLPGTQAHLMFAPVIRREQIASAKLRENAVNSGVIILTYPDEKGQLCWVFIRRPRYNGVHSGQIAFPGGRFEPSDSSFQHTAIREMHEEIGVEIKSGNILGQMTPLYIPPSNYLVYPYLAILDPRPAFNADPKEVAQLIEIPVSFFFKETSYCLHKIPLMHGDFIEAPAYNYNADTCIWGATAMIIHEIVVAFSVISASCKAD